MEIGSFKINTEIQKKISTDVEKVRKILTHDPFLTEYRSRQVVVEAGGGCGYQMVSILGQYIHKPDL